VFIKYSMERKRKLFVAKTAVVLGAIPFVIWAHEYGPDAGYCGVPGELGTCLGSLCHVGTLNGSGGSVKIAFPNGNTYTPGTAQHLTVTISDAAPTQRAWGFQLTARLAGKSNSMAGSFTSTDQLTGVQCASATNVEDELNGGNQINLPQSQACPSNHPLAYIEHSLLGYQTTLGQGGSASYQFDWTPPASNVGNVIFYVAGNAGPPGAPVATNAHVYTATFTLTPAAATGNPPAISAGGVVSAGAFGGFSSVAPGSWMEIYGANLSATSRQWAGSDFNGVDAPTSLDNVKVTIGGQAAFVDFIGSGQVNAQAPSNVAPGTAVPLTVTNPSGTSAAYNITVNALEPGLLAPPAFNIGGKQYAVAQFTDGSFVLPPNSIAGLTTRQAKPGETITFYGIGFGPVITSSNVNIPAGQIVQASNQLTNPMKVQFGNAAPVSPDYAGLAPGLVGLYQFNVKVPSVPNSDLVPLAFTLNGAAGTQTLFTAVHQ